MDAIDKKMLLATPEAHANMRLAEHLVAQKFMSFADGMTALRLAFESMKMTPGQRGAFDAEHLIGRDN
jgi:hypothetical protein